MNADLFWNGAAAVKVSAASARLEFTECGPLCIEANGCNGNCCDAPTRPGGCLVTIHKSEKERIERMGGHVADGLLQPLPGKRGCPFKADGLCTLHESGEKPFGCIASPFTLNRAGTLIVRNRYKLLPCYRGIGPKAPAYRTFFSSLALLFGALRAAEIAGHFDSGGGDITAPMPGAVFAMLRDNDAAKKAAPHV